MSRMKLTCDHDHVARLHDPLKVTPDDRPRLLDVGCTPGIPTMRIATPLSPRASVIGIDAAPESTEEGGIFTIQRLVHRHTPLSCVLVSKPLVTPSGGNA